MTEKLTISAEEFVQRARQQELEILDVRTPLEFQEVHAIGSQNRPLDRLCPDELAAIYNSHPDKPVYLICRSGSRANKACEKLIDAGLQHAVVVNGGIEACVTAGMPVKRGRKAMSLERQTRVAAGGLVAIGGILAVVVHPWFALVSAFVGAGLVFAGLTDSCAMGMFLARMPWNRRSLHDHAKQDPSTPSSGSSSNNVGGCQTSA